MCKYTGHLRDYLRTHPDLIVSCCWVLWPRNDANLALGEDRLQYQERDKTNSTVLHWAAMYGLVRLGMGMYDLWRFFLTLAVILIQNHSINRAGKTPLMGMACQSLYYFGKN